MKLVKENLRKRQECLVSSWAGGTTTEWFIFPENSSYAERNFVWRLSTAEMTIDHSSYTALPGFVRHLMLLEGRCRLEHQGYHIKDLIPGMVDFFSGDWKTECIGKGKDLNLMRLAETEGGLELLNINTEWEAKIFQDNVFFSGSKLFLFFYVIQGECLIKLGDFERFIKQDEVWTGLVSLDTQEKLSLRNLVKGSKVAFGWIFEKGKL